MSEDWFTLRWSGDRVEMLDQRLLPEREEVLQLRTVEEVARAIEDLAVRGAPAIGCAAALGVALAAQTSSAAETVGLRRDVEAACERLAVTRPTAVNLFHAIDRMRAALSAALAHPNASAAAVRQRMVDEAQALIDEDLASCRSIGRASLELVPQDARILTHCNAGGLATAGYGTALGVVRAAAEAGRAPRVLAGETRPFLQGARLTAWELDRESIPVTVHTDNMAGFLLQQGEVDLVVVGADRIASNGDVANKIGTYSLAVLAREHGVPLYVAAPLSTVDFSCDTGASIPIEERGRAEIAEFGGRKILPDGVGVRHPAFDVTPSRLVAAIVTDRGIARADYRQSLASLRDGEAVE